MRTAASGATQALYAIRHWSFVSFLQMKEDARLSGMLSPEQLTLTNEQLKGELENLKASFQQLETEKAALQQTVAALEQDKGR